MILKPKGLFVIQEKKNVSKTPTPVHTPRKLTFKDRCNRRGGCTLHLQQFSSGCVGTQSTVVHTPGSGGGRGATGAGRGGRIE